MPNSLGWQMAAKSDTLGL